MGASMSFKSNDSWTVFHYASDMGYLSYIEFFINFNADINVVDKNDDFILL